MFMIPELRKKLFFTLGVLIVTRLGCYIPVIGVNIPLLGEYMKQATSLGGLLSYLDIFSGGSLASSTLFALGISPYITASIMMQMLGMTVPYLEQLVKEGDYGRKIINQYTRYLTLGLSVMYSFPYALYLETHNLALTPGWGFRILFVISLTVGAMFVMWLGEQISLFGIGNGSSMIIFSGIVSKFPEYIIKTKAMIDAGSINIFQALLILAIFLAITACIVFLEKGERKIPVQYARRVVGQRVYGGQSTYIPFRINNASIMPIIFTSAVINAPLALVGLLSQKIEFFKGFVEWFSQMGVVYNALQIILIIFF
jgi:preprotein translocase subunit SecY